MWGYNTKYILAVLISIILFSSCFWRKTIFPLPKKAIAFCTSNFRSVKGSLFYKQMIGHTKGKDEILIIGKLVFDDLDGWYTKGPVPSYLYLTGNKKSKNKYSEEPVSFYSYWTGDERSICYIQTWVRISKFKGKYFDISKLDLEYHNTDFLNNIILSPDNDKNKKYFKLSYDAQPLEINEFEIMEQNNINIKHCIVILSNFSSS